MRIKIESALVLVNKNCVDKVYLKTNLPCSFNKEFLPSQPSTDLHFDASQGTGADYVRKHFGIEPEIVNTSPSA